MRRLYSPDHREAICLKQMFGCILERAGEFDLPSWAVKSGIRDYRSELTECPEHKGAFGIEKAYGTTYMSKTLFVLVSLSDHFNRSGRISGAVPLTSLD